MRWLRLSSWIYLGLVIILPLTALLVKIRISSFSFSLLISHSFTNSLIIALITTLMAVLLGGLAAVFLAKSPISGKRIWSILLVMPLFFVPYQSALSWSALMHSGRLSAFIFSRAGVIFILTGCFYPITFWFTLVAISSIPRVEEESGLLISSPGQVFSRITLPKILPSLLTGGILVFLLAFTELGVPTYLGIPVLPYEVLIQFATKYDFQAAVASTLPMTFVVILLLLWEYRSLRQGFIFYQQRTEAPGLVFDLKGYPLILIKGFLLCILFLFLIIPLGTLIIQSAHLNAISFAMKNSFKSLGRSIFYGLIAGFIAALWSITALFFRKGEENPAFSFLTLTGFFLPPPLIAIALIAFWGELPGLSLVYSSFLILILGLLARFSVFSYRAMSTAFENLDQSSWEAAYLMTDSWWIILKKIVYPQVRPWFFLGMCIVFIFSMNELGLSTILYPPGQEPLIVRLYTLSVNNPLPFSSSLALLNSLGTLLIIVIFYRWGMR